MIEVDTAASHVDRGSAAKPTTFGYRAFGLDIRSELELAELAPGTVDVPDLAIRFGTTGRQLPPASVGTASEFGPGEQYLGWNAVGGFLIRDAHEIIIQPAPGASELLLHLPLLGPVMALLLHLRGLLVLHASAIAIGNHSAIFVGDKGAGKSTTAAAMVAAGHRLLSDDIVAIDLSRAGGPSIAPGFPQLKLDVTASEYAAGGCVTVLPPVLPDFPKRQYLLEDRFSQAVATPARIYVLERGPLARLSPLAVPDALTTLLRFSYVTRFGSRALDHRGAASHLKQCAVLAGLVGVSRIEVPDRVDRLGEAVRLVEDDLAGPTAQHLPLS